jgi:D-alanyl-lipoteichoic acid acyltransferase DltB (MBOAT superfamily)
MLFNSLSFLLFFPIVLLGHALLKDRPLRLWLVIMSYVFYSWGQPWWYAGLLFFTTAVDYQVAQRIALARSPRARKGWLMISVIGNLSVLGLFKYLEYLMALTNRFSGWLHLGFSVPVPDLPLPVGISFYTFQTMSYTIDVYRGKLAPARSFLNLALYVAFFPQLVAGPIERAGNLLHQLSQKMARTSEDVLLGLTRIFWGLAKKVVAAEWLGIVVNRVYGHHETATTWDLLLATYGFAFQVYLDFSAYSDIAIGLSRTMGIRLVENFRTPYLARTMSEYWNRWHISLSTWLRDYLYFPLGGSRKGAWRTVLNIFLVMMLGGLWHGASNTFLLWGLWIGLGIALYHLYRIYILGGVKDDPERPLAWRDLVPIILTFHWMVLSRVFFRAHSGEQAFHILGKFFTQPWGPVHFDVPLCDVWRAVGFMALAMVAQLARRLGWRTTWPAQGYSPVLAGALWGLLATAILLLFAPTQSQFIYFQF